MKKEVLSYFKELHNDASLTIENGVIKLNNGFSELESTYTSNVQTTTHNKTIFYTKDIDNLGVALQSIATSRLYSKLGINTPEIYLSKSRQGKLKTLSQDVSSLDGLISQIAMQCPEVRKKRHAYGEFFYNFFKWQVFLDPSTQRKMKEYMTDECYNKLLNIIIADELRTDSDRHACNYFLVKHPETSKYHDIIPIDFDLCQIILAKVKTEKDFQSFISEKVYTSATPTGASDNLLTYSKRIEDLRNLLQAGNIPEEQINFIRTYLNTRLSDEIQNIETPSQLQYCKASTHDTFAILEEYNLKTLGHDLGM